MDRQCLDSLKTEFRKSRKFRESRESGEFRQCRQFGFNSIDRESS